MKIFKDRFSRKDDSRRIRVTVGASLGTDFVFDRTLGVHRNEKCLAKDWLFRVLRETKI